MKHFTKYVETTLMYAGNSSAPPEYQEKFFFLQQTLKSIPYFTAVKDCSYCQQLNWVLNLLAFLGGVQGEKKKIIEFISWKLTPTRQETHWGGCTKTGSLLIATGLKFTKCTGLYSVKNNSRIIGEDIWFSSIQNVRKS